MLNYILLLIYRIGIYRVIGVALRNYNRLPNYIIFICYITNFKFVMDHSFGSTYHIIISAFPYYCI